MPPRLVLPLRKWSKRRPGVPHKDVGLIAQFPPFFVIVLAAAHGKDADWRAVSKLLDFTCRLLGQLPCRGKNEGLDEGLYFRNFFVKRGTTKGKGLPHPRLGAANGRPVPAKGGDGAFLHRRRNILSSLMESFNKRRRNHQIEQNYLAWRVSPFLFIKISCSSLYTKDQESGNGGSPAILLFHCKGRCFRPLTTLHSLLQ